MKIIMKRLEDLAPYENNPRINDGAVDATAKSIAEFGFKVPMVITTDGVIIAGHTRKKAAEKLGLEEVPCIIADDLTEEQVRAFRLADNKTAEMAEWDIELLDSELEEITNIDMSLFGFDIGEIEPPKITEPEEIEPEEVETRTEPGQLWQLGEHRLICGDATDSGTIEKLVGGARINILYTDPPYGMKLDTDYTSMVNDLEISKQKKLKGGKKYAKVVGDNDDFDPRLITSLFENFPKVKEAFIWGADYFPEHISGYKDGSFFVWDKRLDESADKGFGSCFELCWSKERHKRDIARVKWFGVFGLSGEDTKSRVHPTQKPTELARWFLERYSKPGDGVADVYGGSGSTLIACEILQRRAYVCEIQPEYCDVILARWEKLTEKKAQLISE